jgi:hypothetical protein
MKRKTQIAVHTRVRQYALKLAESDLGRVALDNRAIAHVTRPC